MSDAGYFIDEETGRVHPQAIRDPFALLPVVFWKNIDFLSNGCMIWTGTMDSRRDIPRLNLDGRKIAPRRFLFEHRYRRKLSSSDNLYSTCGDSRCVASGHAHIASASPRCVNGHLRNARNGVWEEKRGKRYFRCRACVRDAYHRLPLAVRRARWARDK